MMANMQAAQKKLDDLVAQMNAATGSEKVDRMAAVITEMAAMHKDMCAQMMNGGMMSMMMQMQHGAASPSRLRPTRNHRTPITPDITTRTSGDVEQHDVEHERRVRRNGAHHLLSVSKVRRDDEPALSADLHPDDPLIPAGE